MGSTAYGLFGKEHNLSKFFHSEYVFFLWNAGILHLVLVISKPNNKRLPNLKSKSVNL